VQPQEIQSLRQPQPSSCLNADSPYLSIQHHHSSHGPQKAP
jgi:hypothetical protein